MILHPPGATRTDTLVPYTTLCRSQTGRCPVRLQVGGIDHQLVGLAGPRRQCREDLVEHAKPAPTNETVIHRLERPVLGWSIAPTQRSEEHTSELQSLMRNSYAVFCLKKKI